MRSCLSFCLSAYACSLTLKVIHFLYIILPKAYCQGDFIDLDYRLEVITVDDGHFGINLTVAQKW